MRDSEKYSLPTMAKKQDDEYEGTHVAEGEYPSHYRDSARKAFEAGRDTSSRSYSTPTRLWNLHHFN